MRKKTIFILLIFLFIATNLSYASGFIKNKLPKDLIWIENSTEPIFSDNNAKKGGMFREAIFDFPVTFRRVGPSSNSSFRGYLTSNNLALIDIHPETKKPIPMLAKRWAIGSDKKSVYYELNKKAHWSDGVPVTVSDFLFTLKFMRSKEIVAPWYNNYYTEEILDIKAYGEDIISVHLANKKSDEELVYYANLAPVAKHFHKKNLDKDWVRWANWKIEPVTGAYYIDNFKKGSYIEFKRVSPWWGDNERYLKNRFNFDKVRLKVIRNLNIAWNLFLKGEIDSFPATVPSYWYDRAKGRAFDNGWIGKYWLYNDVPQPSSAIYLNLDEYIFKDKKVRYAIAHAINIDKVNKSLLRGDYDRLQNISTGYGKYTNHNVKARTFDLDIANTLLDSSGWNRKDKNGIRVKDNKKLSFYLTYGSNEHSARLSLIKSEAIKAGIDIKLKLLDGISMYRNIMENKHQAAWMAWSTSFTPQYWGQFHSDNAHKTQTNNVTNTDDKELDTLINFYKKATSKNDRVVYAHKIQKKIYDIGAVIPTYITPYERFVAWRYIKVPENYPKYLSDIISPMKTGIIWLDENIKNKVKNKEKLPKVVIKNERYRKK